MHVPDGFLDAPTSLATAALAGGTIALALHRSKAELDERAAPLAGLTAAYVFAVQMINFPVGVGTSGHVMGGALAAVLVGPWTAILVLSVVLGVQALVFADGGLTALGTNVLLMGIVTVVVGWAVSRLALRALPARAHSVVPAAFLGALLSVPAAAGVFVVLYLLGGATPLPVGPLMVSMLGWHTVIGLGEALITGATVGAVVAVRPDLVHAARRLGPTLVLRDSSGSAGEQRMPPASPESWVPASPISTATARPGRALLIGAVGATLVLAGVASSYASASPDGLEFVAEQQGFDGAAVQHALGSTLLADYGEVGGIPVGLAGVLGVGATLLVTSGTMLVLRRRHKGASMAESV